MDDAAEELESRLASMRPVVTWAKATQAIDLDFGDMWRLEESGSQWPMNNPPEDYALPPLVHWTDDLRELAQSVYNARYGKFLEPGESYEITWPPTGYLGTQGEWKWSEPEECGEHGDEHENDCEECEGLSEGGDRRRLSDAQWCWKVSVHRHLVDGDVEFDDDVGGWDIGRTPVAPWSVEYSTYPFKEFREPVMTAVGWVVEEAATKSAAQEEERGKFTRKR